MENLQNIGILELNSNELQHTNGGGWIRKAVELSIALNVIFIAEFTDGVNDAYNNMR